MNTQKITIIGVGNIGTAIAEGLIRNQFCKVSNVTLVKRNTATLHRFEERGAKITSDNVKAISEANYIILAVKPFQIREIAEEIAPHVDYTKQVLISVITGVWLEDLKTLFSDEAVLFRAMPNTAAAIGESMTTVAHCNATQEELSFVTSLFETVGEVVMINEQLMDAATVLGACGTAFALRYIRANIQGGIEIGFDANTATLIAAQTVKGAASLLLENKTHPEQEIDKVTTPKGCTIAGLNEMEHQGFSSSLIRGLKASYDKIVKDM